MGARARVRKAHDLFEDLAQAAEHLGAGCAVCASVGRLSVDVRGRGFGAMLLHLWSRPRCPTRAWAVAWGRGSLTVHGWLAGGCWRASGEVSGQNPLSAAAGHCGLRPVLLGEPGEFRGNPGARVVTVVLAGGVRGREEVWRKRGREQKRRRCWWAALDTHGGRRAPDDSARIPHTLVHDLVCDGACCVLCPWRRGDARYVGAYGSV